MRNATDAIRALAGKPQRLAFFTALWNGLRADAPLYLAIAVYTIAGLAFLDATGLTQLASYSSYVGKWLLGFGFLFPTVTLLLHYGFLIHRFEHRRLLAARRIFSPARAAHFVASICLLLSLVAFQ